MWTDNGRLLEQLHGAADSAVSKLPGDAALSAVERVVSDALRRSAKQFNNRRPEVIVIAHEADPRAGAAANASAVRRRGSGGGAGTAGGGERHMSEEEAAGLLEERRVKKQQQREKDLLFAGKGGDVEEMGATESEGSDSDDGQSIAGRMAQRGSRMVMRGGRGAGRSGGRGSPPPLQRLPPDAIRRRQRANPRDSPEQGGNVEYP
jgi:hypothetical protein